MTTTIVRTLPSLSADHDGMRAGFMEVTPELAATWLSLLNTHNRSLNRNRVAMYARDMKDGNWHGTGDTLKFAGDFGQLLDAQHRLTAQVEADVTLTWLIVTGVDPGAQSVMDNLRSRQFKDALHIDGVKNANIVAATVRCVDAYATTGLGVSGQARYSPSSAELARRFEAHPEIVDHIMQGILGMSGSMISALSYLTALADHEDSEAFITALKHGHELEVGNPIYTLRERLMSVANSSAHLPTSVRWVFAVRSWNAWRAGESLKQLKFKPGGARPDRIPTLDGIQPEDIA